MFKKSEGNPCVHFSSTNVCLAAVYSELVY